MIKTILVGSTGSAADAAAFGAALTIAKPFGAHLDVLHVRVDVVNTTAAMMTDVGSGALTAGLIERLEADARTREATAQEIFTRFCTVAGVAVTSTPSVRDVAAPSAEWHVETGDEARWMAAYGGAADLIVAPRGTGDEATVRATLEAALLETGRPLLIPSAAAMPAAFDRIAIAWKSTPQAARAVALAMPFLARAKEIVVITVEEDAGERAPAERLVRNFRWHGLAARSEQLKPAAEGAPATLLAGARERADLLVMGGYGHTRLREWAFGGFTRQVLDAAPLPVLIAH